MDKKVEFIGYTVREWKYKYYPNSEHRRFDVKKDIEVKIPSNLVICDVCNKEIRQPKDSHNKKVVWDYSGGHKEGNWALCTDCKNNPERFNKSKRLMDGYKKMIKYPEKKLEAIEDFVNDSLLIGLKKGWYKFQDNSMTVDKWLKLSGDEKERYPIGLTELGKKEDKDTENNILQLIQDQDIVKSLFDKFGIDKEGNVKIHLTKLGQQMKMMYELGGLDFSGFIQKKLRHGVRRMFSEYIVLEKNETEIKGQMRLLKKV